MCLILLTLKHPAITIKHLSRDVLCQGLWPPRTQTSFSFWALEASGEMREHPGALLWAGKSVRVTKYAHHLQEGLGSHCKAWDDRDGRNTEVAHGQGLASKQWGKGWRERLLRFWPGRAQEHGGPGWEAFGNKIVVYLGPCWLQGLCADLSQFLRLLLETWYTLWMPINTWMSMCSSNVPYVHNHYHIAPVAFT